MTNEDKQKIQMIKNNQQQYFEQKYQDQSSLPTYQTHGGYSLMYQDAQFQHQPYSTNYNPNGQVSQNDYYGQDQNYSYSGGYGELFQDTTVQPYDSMECPQATKDVTYHEDWICEKCKGLNFSRRNKCYKCDTAKTENSQIVLAMKHKSSETKKGKISQSQFQSDYFNLLEEFNQTVPVPFEVSTETTNQLLQQTSSQKQNQIEKMKHMTDAQIIEQIQQEKEKQIQQRIESNQEQPLESKTMVTVHFCTLCNRMFKSKDVLKKHFEKSKLHLENTIELEKKQNAQKKATEQQIMQFEINITRKPFVKQ